MSAKKKHVAPPQKTNKKKGSLVKVVVEEDQGKWVSPDKGAVFKIDKAAAMPAIQFQIDTAQPGPYKWSWTITWEAKVSGLKESAKRGSLLKTFTEKGAFESSDKSWSVNLGKVLGGRLRVVVTAGEETFKRYVDIQGTNPPGADVTAFVATIADTEGLDKLLEQESHHKHFIDADGQPIVAFDKGYGMTQMTNPAPTYEQVWSWKENIKAGAKLYQDKQKAAKAYLGQKGRSYTPDQLRLETWTRWNGGTYHVWDDKAKAWVRNTTIQCDTATGNIGWDMTVDGNKGKTEQELHERDKDSYAKPKDKKEENKWKYTGICYADHVDSH
jgi:hypothetical protein